MAFAQAAVAVSASNDIEEIVVIGERWQRTLDETTHSVVVFTDEQLERLTERDTTELFSRIPNVTVDAIDGRISIREMDDQGFDGFGYNTNMQMDGVTYTPYFISDAQFPLWDISQIEILRGAQTGGALQSQSGVIALRTKDPAFESSGRAMFDAREDGRRETGIAHGGTLKDDVLAYRIAAYGSTDPGSLRNVALADGEWDDDERYMLRTKFLYQPAWWQDARIKLTYQGQKDVLGARSPTINRVLSRDGYDPFDRTTDLNTAEWRRNYFNITTLEAEHPISAAWTAHHAISYQHRRFTEANDFDQTGLVEQRLDESYRSRSLQVLSTFSYSGTWNVETGFSYIGFYPSDDVLQVVFPVDIDGPGPTPGIEAGQSFGFDDDIWGFFVFGYASRDWASGWGVDLGGKLLTGAIESKRFVRLERLNSTGTQGLDIFYDSILGPETLLEDDNRPTDTKLLPLLAVRYELTEDLNVGLRWEQGYRIAQTDINRARAIAVGYDPETSNQYELFMRSAWLDKRLRISLNVFRIDYDDLQLRRCFSADPLDCNIVNAADGSSEGIELEAAWQINPAWQAGLSLGITDTEYSKIRALIEENPTQEARNDKTPWSINANLDYSGENGFFAGLDWVYRSAGAYDLRADNTVEAESLSLLNVRSGVRLQFAKRVMEASVYVRNVTDEEYLLFIDPALPSGFFQRAAVGDPREAGLSLRFDW